MSELRRSETEHMLRRAEQSLKEGDLDSAERYTGRALEQDSTDHAALALKGEIRLRRKDVLGAFHSFTLAVNAAPDVHLYKERFLELARGGLDVKFSNELENAIVACLKTPDLVGFVENWARLLFAIPEFHATYGLAHRRPFDPANTTFFASLRDFRPLLRPLFLEGLKRDVVCDPVFEEFVTHIRRRLLEGLGASDGGLTTQERVSLACSLAHYALLTDFILAETDAERRLVDELCRRIEGAEATELDASTIAIAACYRPLHALKNAEAIWGAFESLEPLAGVVKAQIADHFAIREAARSIPSLTSIDSDVSVKVRKQYEDFPYPRWTTLSKIRVVQDWQNHELSRKIEGPLKGKRRAILIAGCGTGRDAVIHSAIFPDASVTAIDVSRASLGYAATKAKEHGCENIAFRHGDILNLGSIDGTFDLVCCTGVLHHLEDPVLGWSVLRDLLKPGGVMRIGLYSRLGRKAVIAAQDAVRRGNYAPTREGILQFRHECSRICSQETLRELSGLKDYYHMNMYRDLLFPAQEHRFDLLEIKDILKQLGLAFEGFYLSDDVVSLYRTIFRYDAGATDLDHWHQFEMQFPHTFASMYIFWCRKPEAR